MVKGGQGKGPQRKVRGLCVSLPHATRYRFTGELATSLPCYPDSLSLKVQVQIRERDKRPSVEVLALDSPLHSEQHLGITQKRVRELCHALVRKELPALARADE